MAPNLIPVMTAERLKTKGISDYRSVHKQYWVYPGKELELPMFSNILFLVGNPMGIEIESELGAYNMDNQNIHEHQGLVYVRNVIGEPVAVEFIKIIFQSIGWKPIIITSNLQLIIN